MPEPVDPLKGLIEPLTGDLVGTWGSAALNPNFTAIGGMLGGVASISLSNAPVTLTAPSGTITPGAGPTQSQNAVLKFTGALSANCFVTLPLPGFYICDNRCTNLNSFTMVLVSTAPVEGVGLPPGTSQVYCDGTNVRLVNMPMVGSLTYLPVASYPPWMLQSTVSPWLTCDGTVYNITSFPLLGALLGSEFGGDGVTTFGVPDLRGRVPLPLDTTGARITVGGCGINGNAINASGGEQVHTLVTGEMPSHIHGVTDPGHTHNLGLFQSQQIGSGGSFPTNLTNTSNTATTTSSTTGVTLQSTGGDGAHNNVQPALVVGLMFIKT